MGSYATDVFVADGTFLQWCSFVQPEAQCQGGAPLDIYVLVPIKYVDHWTIGVTGVYSAKKCKSKSTSAFGLFVWMFQSLLD